DNNTEGRGQAPAPAGQPEVKHVSPTVNATAFPPPGASPPVKPTITDTEIINAGVGVITSYLLKGRAGAAAWAKGDAAAYHTASWSRDAWCKISGDPNTPDHELTLAQATSWCCYLAASLRSANGLPLAMPAIGRAAGAVKQVVKERGSPYAAATLMQTIVMNWPTIHAGLGTYGQSIALDPTLLQNKNVVALADRIAAGQPVTARNPQPQTQEIQHADRNTDRSWSW
ncbi:MAG: hypothetical protein AAGL98_01190, partial [Planctomycetota bacterium]